MKANKFPHDLFIFEKCLIVKLIVQMCHLAVSLLFLCEIKVQFSKLLHRFVTELMREFNNS